MRALLIGMLLLPAPGPDQAALLKTFREEFVAIKADPPYGIGKVEVPQNLWESVTGSWFRRICGSL